MTTYFKATRPDGTDFYSGKISYLKALENDTLVLHPLPLRPGATQAMGYLSVATVPTDCTGFTWPARLFEVEAPGDVWTPHSGDLPNKRATTQIRVLRELPAYMLFGPQGEQCVAIIDATAELDDETKTALREARTDEWYDAYDRVWQVASGCRADRAGLRAAQYALCYRLVGWGDGDAACGAALAVLTRHLTGEVTAADYAEVTRPWRELVGAVHPDDTLPVKVAS